MSEIVINKRQLLQVTKALERAGKDVVKPLKEAVDFASEAIANHAKGKHFFVGVGKGSSARAREGELVFKNPDGSPRFRVRTNNLVKSIQAKASKFRRGSVFGEVVAGIEYARKVEEGGPGTRPFPFMKPALEAVRPKFLKLIRKAVADHIRRFRGKG